MADYSQFWGEGSPMADTANGDASGGWVDPLTAATPPTNPGANETINKAPGPVTPPTNPGANETVNKPPQQVIQDLGIAPSEAVSTPASANPPNYSSLVSAVTSSTSPQATLAAQDALARALVSSLTAAGHKATWDGANMTVDGAPYELPQGGGGIPNDFPNGQGPIGGGPNRYGTETQPNSATIPAGANPPAWPNGIQPNAGETPQQTLDRYQRDYHNDDAASVIQSGQAYVASLSGGGGGGGPMNGMTAAQLSKASPADQRAWLQQALAANGFGGDDVDHWFSQYIGGTGGGWSNPENVQYWMDRIAAGQAGEQPGGKYYESPGSGSSFTPNTADLWAQAEAAMPASTTYTPGTLATPDLPWDYQSLKDELSADTGVTQATTDAMKKLLASGGSMPPELVAKLQARQDETLGQAALQEKQNAKRFGYSNGLADSPWLGAQASSIDQNYDAKVAQGRTDLETTAAKTNFTDQLNAANAGAAFDAQQKAARTSAASTAVQAALGKAAATKDVFALNESLKQAAAQLGLSRTSLIQQYVLGMTGIQLDAKKLDVQSQQFQADLLFRIQQLAQNNDQFEANLGLNYDQLNEQALEAYWKQTSGQAA